MNISREEEFVNQELKQLRFKVTKEIVQHMKIVLVKNMTKWDYTPPPMYTDEDVSSYKYSKQHDNIFDVKLGDADAGHLQSWSNG